MRKHLGVSIAVLVGLLFAAPGASASTEAGWNCTAGSGKAGATLLASPVAGFPISPLVKESRGVIVNWSVRVSPGLGPLAQQLGVFQVVNSGGEYRKVAESATEAAVEGMNSFPARIPVQLGDTIGLYGPVATFVCDEGGSSALYEGGVLLGETRAFETATGVRPAVSAVVEPDADGDGYGDQSQDRCPESALFQTDCPLVAIDVGDVTVNRRAILIEVGVSSEAAVEAIGEVRWLLRPKPTDGAKHSTLFPQVRVGLGAPSRAVTPGAPTVLRVPLPKSVRNRLEQLPPRRALRARIDVKAKSLANQAWTHELKVRLPGRRDRALLPR